MTKRACEGKCVCVHVCLRASTGSTISTNKKANESEAKKCNKDGQATK